MRDAAQTVFVHVSPSRFANYNVNGGDAHRMHLDQLRSHSVSGLHSFVYQCKS